MLLTGQTRTLNNFSRIRHINLDYLEQTGNMITFPKTGDINLLHVESSNDTMSHTVSQEILM